MVSGFLKKKEKKVNFLEEKSMEELTMPPLPEGNLALKTEMKPLITEVQSPKIGIPQIEIPKKIIPVLKPIKKEEKLPKFEEHKLGTVEKKMLLTATIAKPIPRTLTPTSRMLFLQYGDLSAILDNIKTMKKNMSSAETATSNIKDTWGATNAEINTLSDKFEDVQRKLILVDKLIFEKKMG